jgi:signal transduction histidine kinase
MLEEMKQADADPYDEDKRELDLVPLIKNAVSVIPLANLSIDIDVDALEDPCFVYGTHRQLLPIFYNLVVNAVNAIKESGRSGKITITLSDTPQKEGFRRVQIADSGPGLPKQILAFIRKGERFSGIPGGTGLGLITVRATVSAVGGAIDVSSKLGEGTTFTLDLKGPIH